MLAAVRRALQRPESSLPQRSPQTREAKPSRVLTLFLETVLESACARHDINAGLVGGSSELRSVLRWCRNGRDRDDAPRLLQGWRSEVCGQDLLDAIDGRVALRIDDVRSDRPITVAAAAAHDHRRPPTAPAAPPTLILETRGLDIGYGGRRRHVVRANLNLRAAAGECVALIGPNGAGKSTLLRTLAGLQKPLGGTVLLEDRDLSRMRPGDIARTLSVVLTEPNRRRPADRLGRRRAGPRPPRRLQRTPLRPGSTGRPALL